MGLGVCVHGSRCKGRYQDPLCVCVRSRTRMSVSVFPCWWFLSQNTCVRGWLCIRVPAGGESVFSTPRLMPVESSPLACHLGSALHSRQPRQSSVVPPSPTCHPYLCPSVQKPASGLGSPRTPVAGQDVKGSPAPRGTGLASKSRTFFFLTCGTIPFYVRKTDRFNHVHR